MDKNPGKKIVKSEQPGNEVPDPDDARRLGLVEFFKRTAKEIKEDHLAAFAGNLTYKGSVSALFPFACLLLSCSASSWRPDLLNSPSASRRESCCRKTWSVCSKTSS